MELIYTAGGGLCMAHNGWVMGDDPLRNFALPGDKIILVVLFNAGREGTLDCRLQ